MEQQREGTSSEKDSCCICLERLLTPGMGRQTLPCGHIMHEQCITAMRRSGASGKCPLCRAVHEELVPEQVLLDEAVLLFMRGEVEKSLHAYAKVLEVDPGNPYANFAMGEAALNRGDALQALEFYEEAHRNRTTENDFREVAYNIGLLYSRQGNMEKAVPFYEEASRCGDISAKFNLGVYYYNQGNFTEAIQLYEQARLGGHTGATFNLASHYVEQGDLERARWLYEEAHRDGHPKANNNLGLVCELQGDSARAKSLWEEGSGKGCGDSIQNLGKYYMERADADKAIACFEKLHVEGNINGTFGLGEVYANMGNHGKAKQLFEECLRQGHRLAQRALAALDLAAPDTPYLSSDACGFAAGDRVILHGLQSEKGRALNGCRGVIRKYDSGTHRFAVIVEGSKEPKLLKPDNLMTWATYDNPESSPPLLPQVGDTVQIHGLKSCLGQVLNGCMGHVVSYDVTTGRRVVELHGEGGSHAIKPENLEIKTTPPADEDFEDCEIQRAIEESISRNADHINAHRQMPAEVNAQISGALLHSGTADSGPRVVLLKFSRRPRSLSDALLHAPELADCIQALQSHGLRVELQSGAKVFVRPEYYEATLEAIRLGSWTLFPNHVVTEVHLEAVVLRIVEKLPWRESVHPRGSHVVPLGFATSAAQQESKIRVARTFIEVRLATSLRSASHTGPRTASTTDMDPRKCGNHRGKRR